MSLLLYVCVCGCVDVDTKVMSVPHEGAMAASVCIFLYVWLSACLSVALRPWGSWQDAGSKLCRTEVPASLSYHSGVGVEWAHSFPHQDSLPPLIRHLCDWRQEFSACQLIWSHRYGSNLIWGERAGFCQYGWDKAAAFTNPLNKLSRERPVSWQWSSSPSLSVFLMNLHTSHLHPHAKKWCYGSRKRRENGVQIIISKAMNIKIVATGWVLN